MERTAVQRLAKVLKTLVLVVFTLNLICLLLVPGFVAYSLDGGPAEVARVLRRGLEHLITGDGEWYFFLAVMFYSSWWAVWSQWYAGILTIFFWLCGTCTASILWQAKRVLDTILAGNPFQMQNAKSLRRAAVCCWIISGAALGRLVWWLWHDHSAAPFFTYNALFIPAFLMAGLLFQVMSALFRQAAELKEDQDLTI